jgi:hypothetical protein
VWENAITITSARAQVFARRTRRLRTRRAPKWKLRLVRGEGLHWSSVLLLPRWDYDGIDVAPAGSAGFCTARDPIWRGSLEGWWGYTRAAKSPRCHRIKEPNWIEATSRGRETHTLWWFSDKCAADALPVLLIGQFAADRLDMYDAHTSLPSYWLRGLSWDREDLLARFEFEMILYFYSLFVYVKIKIIFKMITLIWIKSLSCKFELLKNSFAVEKYWIVTFAMPIFKFKTSNAWATVLGSFNACAV